MKIKLIFIETGVQKKHIWQFLAAVELKAAISEVGNGVKVTRELREIYGWVTDGLQENHTGLHIDYPGKRGIWIGLCESINILTKPKSQLISILQLGIRILIESNINRAKIHFMQFDFSLLNAG